MEWASRGEVRVLEAKLPGARAAFAARLGGASSYPFDSLNVGLRIGDEDRAVRENRRRLAAALDRDAAGFLIGRQVHGAEIALRSEAPAPNPYLDGRAPPPAECDGQLAASPRLTPIVQVADCLPLAMVGARGVGMLHCGWRGLAAGIVARGAEALEAHAAAIGPAIGPCCYEVGEEVLVLFSDLGAGVATSGRLDLAEVTRRLLARAGVTEVEAAGLCTGCAPDLFFSHRRDGMTGRQGAAAWLGGG